jgi:toxin FitB
MILLDTNIISELWRPLPSRAVERWMDMQPTISLFISAITLGELRYGAMRLATGRRRDYLFLALSRLEEQTFQGRILPFDWHCSAAYGQIRTQREQLGRPILAADAVIAAISKTHGLKLATRNIKDFEALDIELINPFEPDLYPPERP